MRIRISGLDNPTSHEKRAYAEYRFFASIAPYERHIGAVDIMVRPERAVGGQVFCTVTVDLGQCGRIKTQARAMQASASIDRAARRISALIGRRLRRNSSVKSPVFSS